MAGVIGRFKTFLFRHGGGIYRFLLVCFTVVGFVGILQSLELKKSYGECRLSDWSKVTQELDYATNIVCHHRYTDHWAEYMRQPQYEGWGKRIMGGETLTVGIDYYALTNVSAFYLLDESGNFTFFNHFPEVYESILDGNVEIFEASLTRGWVWKR